MELPKTSFDELPSPTSDLAWSPSPSKQRLPALSPHLSLPSPHRRGSFDGSPQRRKDAALELELGAPDGQGGRVGVRRLEAVVGDVKVEDLDDVCDRARGEHERRRP